MLKTEKQAYISSVEGPGTPFKTWTWEEWLDMQAHMFQWFSRFQYAIEHKRPGEAMKIVLQMQDTVMIWTREANE
ncbi:MAG TPA: hypothetical protein VFK47_12650 [Ktedonobacteraceae bacterium]|nr:hypothetical protein [Ktedonobacteraceae bacterium]